MKSFLLALFTVFITQNTFAAIELDFNFGYDKSVFGEDRQNQTVERSYGGSIAFYFLTMTAIEFNYDQSEKETIVNYDTSGSTSGLVIEGESSNLLARTYGVGIRQAFAGRKSFIQPVISLGWARQRFDNSATATLKNIDDSTTSVYKSDVSKFEYDSVFGVFALKFRLTKSMAIKGSVRTSFRAFEFSEAKDQMSYSAGLTWMF